MSQHSAHATAALDAAQKRCKAASLHHYHFDVRMIRLHGGETLRLEVRNEQVVIAWKSDNVTALSPDELRGIGAFFPVTTLLSLLKTTSTDTAASGSVSRGRSRHSSNGSYRAHCGGCHSQVTTR